MGSIRVTVCRGSDLPGISTSKAYCRFNIDDHGKKGKEKSTKEVDGGGDGKRDWGTDETWSVSQPPGGETQLILSVHVSKALRRDPVIGQATLSLSMLSDSSPDHSESVALDKGGKVDVQIHYESTGHVAGSGGGGGVFSKLKRATMERMPEVPDGDVVTVTVRIRNGRSLMLSDLAPGMKPRFFVRTRVREDIQETGRKDEAANPVWGDDFTFSVEQSGKKAVWDEVVRLSVHCELTAAKKAEGVLQTGKVEAVGQVAFPLRQVYARQGHAMEKQWVALSAGDSAGCSGYLLIDATARLPTDKVDEDSDDASSEDSEDVEQERMRECIRGPTAVSEAVMVTLQVFRAEDLPEVDTGAGILGFMKESLGAAKREAEKRADASGRSSDPAGNVDPYVAFHVDGKKVASDHVENRKCPTFDCNLTAPMAIPTMCDALRLDVYDWDKIGNDDLIASTSIPISALVETVHEDGSRMLHLPKMQPRWINLYGRPDEASANDVSTSAGRRMDRQGAAYRGRVLVGVSSSRPRNKAERKRGVSKMDERLVSCVSFECKKYDLYCYAMQGFGLPEGTWSLRVSIGSDSVKTERPVKVDRDGGHADWAHLLSTLSWWEPESIPDIIIHLVDKDSKARAFVRFSAESLLDMRKRVRREWWIGTVPLMEIGDPSKVAGNVVCYLSCALRLSVLDVQGSQRYGLGGESGGLGESLSRAAAARAGSPSLGISTRRALPYDCASRSLDVKLIDTRMRIYVLLARGIPAADDNGQSDPYLKVICPGSTRSGRAAQTHVYWESRCPYWDQTLEIDYTFADGMGHGDAPQQAARPGLVIEVWDKDAIGTDDLLGTAVLLHPGIPTLDAGGSSHGLPDEAAVCPHTSLDWVHLTDLNGRSAGEILLAAEIPPEGKVKFDEVLPQPRKVKAKPHSAALGALTKVGGLFKKKDKGEKAAGPSGDDDLVVPVPPRLRPELQKVDIQIFVLGLRRISRVGVFGLRSPSLQFRYLEETTRVKPKGKTSAKGCIDIMQWVQGGEKEQDKDRPAWRMQLPVDPKYLAPLQLELFDKRAIGGESLVATGLIPLNSVCSQEHPWQFPIPNRGPLSSPSSSPRASSPRSTRTASTFKTQFEGWMPQNPDDALAVWGQTADPERTRYQGRSEVDERGLTPWLADYYYSQDLNDPPEGEEEISRMVVRVPGPLENFASADLRGFGDRLECVPLYKAEGSGTKKVGDAKLLVRIERVEEEGAAGPAPPRRSARSRSVGGEDTMHTEPTRAGSAVMIRAPATLPEAPKAKISAQILPALKEVELKVRVYVIRCDNLVPKDKAPPFMNDPYMMLEVGPEGGKATQKISDQKNHQSNTCNPKFYKSWELDAKLPRDNELRVSVWDYDTIGSDDLIGITKISLEDRWYSGRRKAISWHTERRHLYKLSTTHASGPDAAQGSIELWVDMFEKPRKKTEKDGEKAKEKGKEKAKGPAPAPIPDRLDIAPPPPEEYEMRMVVWNVSGCKMDDTNIFGEQMTDIYVKGFLKNGRKRFKAQDTDVHYRSMDGDGNFNWRMKWDVQYKRREEKLLLKETGVLGKLSRLGFKKEDDGVDPVLVVELWDNDLLPFSDDYIGDVSLPLNMMPMKLSKSEKALLGDKGGSHLKGIVGKMGAGGEEEDGSAGQAFFDMFELDQKTNKPKYLNAETPKIWFPVYCPLDPEEARAMSAGEVADQLYKAMKGLGTNEDRIWKALEKIQSQDHWVDAQKSFKERYFMFMGGDLHAALEDELSGKELLKARSILEKKSLQYDPGPKPANAGADAVPQSVIAKRLYKAMKGWGTDNSAVWAALRDVRTQIHWFEVVGMFEERHSDFWGGDLFAALADELSGFEQEKARVILTETGIVMPLCAPATYNGTFICDQVYSALKGFGSGEAGIYKALSQVQCHEHWLAVQRAFSKRHADMNQGNIHASIAGAIGAKEKLQRARSILAERQADYDAQVAEESSAQRASRRGRRSVDLDASDAAASGRKDKADYLRASSKGDYLALPSPAGGDGPALSEPLLTAEPSAVAGTGDVEMEELLPKQGGLSFGAAAEPEGPPRELVGLVQLSFMLCMSADKEAPALAAGNGRAEPNQNPKLPDPERPASSFSPLTSPLKAFKHILWKNAKKYIALIICLLLTGFTVYLLWESMIHKMVGAQ